MNVRFLCAVTAAGTAALLVFLSVEAVAGGTGCSGSGTVHGLSCTGSCDDPENSCEPMEGSDEAGSYEYCGCSGEGEPACCHVVDRKDGTYSVKGDCPSCGTMGVCCIVNVEGECTAACVNPPCPNEDNECRPSS